MQTPFYNYIHFKLDSQHDINTLKIHKTSYNSIYKYSAYNLSESVMKENEQKTGRDKLQIKKMGKTSQILGKINEQDQKCEGEASSSTIFAEACISLSVAMKSKETRENKVRNSLHIRYKFYIPQ